MVSCGTQLPTTMLLSLIPLAVHYLSPGKSVSTVTVCAWAATISPALSNATMIIGGRNYAGTACVE